MKNVPTELPSQNKMHDDEEGPPIIRGPINARTLGARLFDWHVHAPGPGPGDDYACFQVTSRPNPPGHQRPCSLNNPTHWRQQLR